MDHPSAKIIQRLVRDIHGYQIDMEELDAILEVMDIAETGWTYEPET